MKKTTRVYIEVVDDLSRSVGAALYVEYELLRGKAEAARKVSEEAGNRLKQHQRQHNC